MREKKIIKMMCVVTIESNKMMHNNNKSNII